MVTYICSFFDVSQNGVLKLQDVFVSETDNAKIIINLYFFLLY